MNTFGSEIKAMVDDQLSVRGIKNARVLEVMQGIVRHEFVPHELRGIAYDDRPVSIGYGQTVSQPYMVARMTELLELTGREKVLEIGTGSGYQTVVLAKLSGHVYTLERIPELAREAGKNIEKSGIRNVTVMVGDGSLGASEHAPFDRILVTAGAPRISQILFEQLTPEGKMVVPVGDRLCQTLSVVSSRGGQMVVKKFDNCIFVPLIGKDGWAEGAAV